MHFKQRFEWWIIKCVWTWFEKVLGLEPEMRPSSSCLFSQLLVLLKASNILFTAMQWCERHQGIGTHHFTALCSSVITYNWLYFSFEDLVISENTLSSLNKNCVRVKLVTGSLYNHSLIFEIFHYLHRLIYLASK